MYIPQFDDASLYIIENRIKSVLINRFAAAVMTSTDKCKAESRFVEAAFELYRSNQNVRQWVDKTTNDIIRAIKTPDFLTVTAF